MKKLKPKIKKGALHKQLGIPLDQPIPTITLKKILNGGYINGKKITPLMRKRAYYAMSFRSWQ
jgi:hypothetical protein